MGNLGHVVIPGPREEPYQHRVVRTYAGDPAEWRKVLGDRLLFQWGIFSHPDSPRPVSLDEAGVRFLDRQMELAGVRSPGRILDLGCGWGYVLRYLAEMFPECPRLEGLNVSGTQLEHCGRYLAREGLGDRVRLYLCNARDVAMLPDAEVPYDLVVIRGVITHFPPEVYEACVAGLARRVRGGGRLVISENLYTVPLAGYRSAIPDEVDRLAVGHRKTPEYLVGVLERAGFSIVDLRVLPSNTDVARWLLEVHSNLETHFPNGSPGALDELRVVAVNLSVALLLDKVSAYSVVAERSGAEARS